MDVDVAANVVLTAAAPVVAADAAAVDAVRACNDALVAADY